MLRVRVIKRVHGRDCEMIRCGIVIGALLLSCGNANAAEQTVDALIEWTEFGSNALNVPKSIADSDEFKSELKKVESESIQSLQKRLAEFVAADNLLITPSLATMEQVAVRHQLAKKILERDEAKARKFIESLPKKMQAEFVALLLEIGRLQSENSKLRRQVMLLEAKGTK